MNNTECFVASPLHQSSTIQSLGNFMGVGQKGCKRQQKEESYEMQAVRHDVLVAQPAVVAWARPAQNEANETSSMDGEEGLKAPPLAEG